MNARYSTRVVPVLLALFAGTGVAPESASADLRPSDVTVSADPDSLFTGERLHYVIIVRHDGQEPISIASLAAGQGTPFEIISSKSNTKKLDSGGMEYRMDTELAPFGLGRQSLPRFRVIAGKETLADGKRLDIIPAETVTVLSLTDPSVRELRPIVPPVGAPFPFWLLFPVLVVLLVLLLLFGIMRSLYGKLKSILVDPVRASRKRLRTIRRQLSKGLSPADGYESLSNILREFLQKRYSFGAMEMVTQEIAEELATRNSNIREELVKLLVQADLVKFADSRPTIDECRRSLRVAEVLVATATATEQQEPPIPDNG